MDSRLMRNHTCCLFPVFLFIKKKNMMQVFASIITTLSFLFLVLTIKAQDNLSRVIWIEYPDRFCEPDSIVMDGVDSVKLTSNSINVLKNGRTGYKFYLKGSTYRYGKRPERHLVIPSTYASNDYTKETSQWCLQRSRESEHFVIFWEKGIPENNGTLTYDGFSCNVNSMLSQAEKIWDTYVNDLGFLSPGSSTTDSRKIQMYVVKNGWGGAGDTWRADGSGVDGTEKYVSGSTLKTGRAAKTGIFHCTTRAATARNGHTLAHEIGHTFQYLVGADNAYNKRTNKPGLNYVLGGNTSKGNEWWEDCANWQAYKVYPQMQYTDGEYFEKYLDKHHLNIHHEDSRYTNCFYHDWWCEKHGLNTIGTIWREAVQYDDPTQTYMKLYGLNEASFADEQFEGYMHLVCADIKGIHASARTKVGREPQRLKKVHEDILAKHLDGDNRWWIVSPDYCVQNYGFNANPIKVPAEGTVVKASFKGLTGVSGYRNINPSYAGWRYGIAAYCSDGTSVYSDIRKDREGEVTFTVPKGAEKMWFVVMGAPTTYWSHPWDDDSSNDEQWPYAVKFENTDAEGAMRTYGEFPEDYARHDTTVVVNVMLPYDAYNYSSVNVQYDMNAISEALGLSTAQLKSVKCNDTTANLGDIRFAGMNASSTFNYNTTTTTSSDNVYGHWFSTAGTICDYGGSSAIFAEMNRTNYVCKIGQYPGRLVRGKTYVIRQAICYTYKPSTTIRTVKAIMEVHLTVE